MDHPTTAVPEFIHDGDFLCVLKAHGYEIAPRLAEVAAILLKQRKRGRDL